MSQSSIDILKGAQKKKPIAGINGVSRSQASIRQQVPLVASESYLQRYEKVISSELHGNEVEIVVRSNEQLRECLRDLNFFITKKVEKEKDAMLSGKFAFSGNNNSNNVSRSSTMFSSDKSEEQKQAETMALLEREQKNNAFISQQQEKELRLLDEKLAQLTANSHFELVATIESLTEQIKRERNEIKQSKTFNFIEGKYLDKVINTLPMPKVVEKQQDKLLDSLKQQQANAKLREQFAKREELIKDYMKKIEAVDKDFQKAKQIEQRIKPAPVNESLALAISNEKKKIKIVEDAIELLVHSFERETLKYTNIQKDLRMLTNHTEEKINATEVSIRQLNADIASLKQLANQVAPNKFDANNLNNSQEFNISAGQTGGDADDLFNSENNTSNLNEQTKQKRPSATIQSIKKPVKPVSEATGQKIPSSSNLSPVLRVSSTKPAAGKTSAVNLSKASHKVDDLNDLNSEEQDRKNFHSSDFLDDDSAIFNSNQQNSKQTENNKQTTFLTSAQQQQQKPQQAQQQQQQQQQHVEKKPEVKKQPEILVNENYDDLDDFGEKPDETVAQKKPNNAAVPNPIENKKDAAPKKSQLKVEDDDDDLDEIEAELKKLEEQEAKQAAAAAAAKKVKTTSVTQTGGPDSNDRVIVPTNRASIQNSLLSNTTNNATQPQAESKQSGSNSQQQQPVATATATAAATSNTNGAGTATSKNPALQPISTNPQNQQSNVASSSVNAGTSQTTENRKSVLANNQQQSSSSSQQQLQQSKPSNSNIPPLEKKNEQQQQQSAAQGNVKAQGGSNAAVAANSNNQTATVVNEKTKKPPVEEKKKDVWEELSDL